MGAPKSATGAELAGSTTASPGRPCDARGSSRWLRRASGSPTMSVHGRDPLYPSTARFARAAAPDLHAGAHTSDIFPRDMKARHCGRAAVVFLLLFMAATAVLASIVDPSECDQPCGTSHCGDCAFCSAPAALVVAPVLPAITLQRAVAPEATEHPGSGWAPAHDHVPLPSRA